MGDLDLRVVGALSSHARRSRRARHGRQQSEVSVLHNIGVAYATSMNEVLHQDERELQQAALDHLKLIGDVSRYQADAIRFATEVGIPKQRIHELTGRSRSAINQTLSREMQRNPPPS